MNEEKIKGLAKAAVGAAAINNTGGTATWTSAYKSNVCEVVEHCLITVITELNRLSMERESKLLLKIEELSKKVNGNSGTYSANVVKTMLTSKRPEHREQQQQLCTLIDRQTKDAKDRETNVIISGIEERTDVTDQVQVQQFFTAAGVGGVTPKHVRRLKPSINNTTNNSNILQVSQSNKDEHANVLKTCSRHSLQQYSKVFVREDRTPSQQQEFNKTRTEMKKKNDELEAAQLLDTPFRNVIHRRTGRLCCINVDKSNEAKKYVFESATAALNEYRKRSNPDSTAPANTTTGAVAATSTSN
jgi:hypothetical protein